MGFNLKVPFNKPYLTGKEHGYARQAHANAMLAGDGPFTKFCHEWLETNTGCYKALLTHSCTAALEMCALLLNIEPGDEIIMPSYTFVSSANAFVIRGGVPVFVDIRGDTQNIDENLIASAITPRTKAILVVHYAGVACEMDTILSIARAHNLLVIEDAAQGIMSTYKGRPLGSIGDLGAYSFHETKNIISGEGGALLVNNANMAYRAEIIREKGTDRTRFFRGEIDKYTWQDIGSSFLPGEITASFLRAQLEDAEWITNERMNIWTYYHQLLQELEKSGLIVRPSVPASCHSNGHIYYILLAPHISRQSVLSFMKTEGIGALFHYVPLHSSPAGIKFTRSYGVLPTTVEHSERLLRLPLWIGLSQADQTQVVDALTKAIQLGQKGSDYAT